MRKTIFVLILFWLAPLLAQSGAEKTVLDRVQQMVESQGTVIFSDLYNDDRFSSEEKAFLGRLYEIFFQIPVLLKSEYEILGEMPTRRHIASSFGISPPAEELLLVVMESDPRVPPLFERDPVSREIQSLKLDNIEAFIQNRGSEVKLTQWEGDRLPAFELTSFKGQNIQNNDTAGKNLLIYLWFTGCPPCVRIAPILADLDRKYATSNFQVIGFNADHVIGVTATDQQRETYLQEHNLHFENVHLDQATWEAFGNVNVFPTLFFVGSDGIIFRHMINYQDRESLESAIQELIQTG